MAKHRRGWRFDIEAVEDRRLLAEDSYEQNDSFEEAFDLGTGAGVASITIDPAGDPD